MDEEEHRAYHRRLLYIIIVLLFILFGGATFYHLQEGWRYIDALYFSSLTMTTVGYGDFVPKTDVGKIFSIFYAFTGVGIALYGLSLLSAHFIEVREEFWLHQIGKIKIRHHTESFWVKIKQALNFSSSRLTDGEYEAPNKKKK